MLNFLNNLEIPALSQATLNALDQPLSNEELTVVLQNMQNNKAPGSDGFCVEFYKAFSNKLVPLLNSVYMESLTNGSLPSMLKQASINVLLKTDKDPEICSSYRPLSLMNVDTKILAKALAHRLDKVLPLIISEEQIGFIKGCLLFYDICTLFDVIYTHEKTTSPEVVILVDAEKAFDRVEWHYLFAVLGKFGFGKGLIS